MPELIPILSKEEIDIRVNEIAAQISDTYKDRKLVLLGILKGAFIFLSDLVRKLTIPVQIDFIGASSYGSNTSSSGKIKITKEPTIDLKGCDIILVEDIVDTGLTLSYLKEYIKAFSPASVKLCTLIDKQERRESDIKVDYICHKVKEGFLVGYGLDCNEEYRNLPAIYHLKF